eukprot:1375965-Rhodomonas_salina.1
MNVAFGAIHDRRVIVAGLPTASETYAEAQSTTGVAQSPAGVVKERQFQEAKAESKPLMPRGRRRDLLC